VLTQEREPSSHCVVSYFYFTISAVAELPRGETFFSLSPRLRNHPSCFPCIGFGFPSESTRTGTFFIHAYKLIARVCVRATIHRVGVYAARTLIPSRCGPLLRKVFQNYAKPCLVWQCGKRTLPSPPRIGSPEGVHRSRWRNFEFCIQTNSSFRRCGRYEKRVEWIPQNRSRECIGTELFPNAEICRGNCLN